MRALRKVVRLVGSLARIERALRAVVTCSLLRTPTHTPRALPASLIAKGANETPTQVLDPETNEPIQANDNLDFTQKNIYNVW